MTRPLLILDLDETLVHGTRQSLPADHDLKCGDYFIYKRPFVDQFVTSCAQWYELAVWTSATADYAKGIVSELFAEVELEFMWARDRCTRRFDFELQEPYWVKDLKKVKRAGFKLERVLMVDDTQRKLERNYGNIVRVSEFTGDPSDMELPALAKYLNQLRHEEDFRKIEKRGWRPDR